MGHRKLGFKKVGISEYVGKRCCIHVTLPFATTARCMRKRRFLSENVVDKNIFIHSVTTPTADFCVCKDSVCEKQVRLWLCKGAIELVSIMKTMIPT